MLVAGGFMATERRIRYEEFVRNLPDILDELAREREILLVEKNGTTFWVGIASPGRAGLPPTPPTDVVRRILKETAGGFQTPDREGFLRELRELRGHDSESKSA
jgi:hypothetical protein